MTFESLVGQYLFLPMLDTFEWPDNMWPCFEILVGHGFIGRMTCLYSAASQDKTLTGVIQYDEQDQRLNIVFDALLGHPECDVEGSFCELYKAPSQEAIRRMQSATHYEWVETSAGEYNLWLKTSAHGDAILKFAVSDEFEEAVGARARANLINQTG